MSPGEFAAESRRRQGLPEDIEDEETLRRAVALLLARQLDADADDQDQRGQ